jgi:hypothetical protein
MLNSPFQPGAFREDALKLALTTDDICELAIYPTKVLEAELQRRYIALKLAANQTIRTANQVPQNGGKNAAAL